VNSFITFPHMDACLHTHWTRLAALDDCLGYLGWKQLTGGWVGGLQETNLILWEDRQNMRLLWLNRGKALHALNTEMCEQISAKLE